MGLVINLLVVLATLFILFYAYFKKSTLGRYSVYVIFASILLQELFGILNTFDIFDFLNSIYSTITTFVIYGEIILLVILAIRGFTKGANKYFKISIVFLIVLKVLQVLGLF